jgi:hypothetical protein
MRLPLVSIITVNYNQTQATCDLLESVRRQGYPRTEVIVVDNGSAENPGHTLRKRFPEIKFIRSERNRGFAGGNNLALERAAGDYYFFINNDAELTEGCIERLLALFDAVPGLGIVSPLLCYPPDASGPAAIQYAGMTGVNPYTGRNSTIGQGATDWERFDRAAPTAYAHGAAMIIPRRVLERIGLMSEDYFLYYEELDWCERIRRAGYGVWVEPRARVYHHESRTVKTLGALKTYYLNRNRVWFMKRHYDGWNLYVFYVFLICIVIPKNVFVFIKRGETDNLKAFLSGVFHALGGLGNTPPDRGKRRETPPQTVAPKPVDF